MLQYCFMPSSNPSVGQIRPKPTDALLGVETLAEPEYLIEVDAIAVVD
jgi:enamine deaminase RidA (YjgF/YER057c/UK114 family)